MTKEMMMSIFNYLRFSVLPILEYPCEHCGYFECKKFDLKTFLKKRYAEEDMIDYKDCLKRKREKLKELLMILRDPIFHKYSNEQCEKCKRKMFWRDMNIHSECEKKNPNLPKDSYKMKIFRLCPKCDRIYTTRKMALFEGFEKR